MVDYDSPTSLAAAFADIDVVISTLGGAAEAINIQGEIAKAAKLASVKLFVPSEFGGDTRNGTTGAFLRKKQIHAKLKEIGLPYSLFFTGAFSDFVFIPYVKIFHLEFDQSHDMTRPLGFDFAEGKVNIGGSGNFPVSFTSRPDIARYLTYVLTTLPASKLEWSVFRIEGERLVRSNYFHLIQLNPYILTELQRRHLRLRKEDWQETRSHLQISRRIEGNSCQGPRRFRDSAMVALGSGSRNGG